VSQFEGVDGFGGCEVLWQLGDELVGVLEEVSVVVGGHGGAGGDGDLSFGSLCGHLSTLFFVS